MITDSEPIAAVQKGAQEAQEKLEEMAREKQPFVSLMARLGYAAKGVIYLMVGLLAFRAMLGLGNANVDTKDALMAIFLQPFGAYLLLATAVGLAGYVFWRLVQALLDTEAAGTNVKGIVKRTAYTVSGIAYAGLMVLAVRLLLGMGPGTEQNSTEHWTARVLSLPLGGWVVGMAGVLVFGLGLYQYYLGFSKLWKRKFRFEEMSTAARNTVLVVGQFGIAARGIVYNVIGVFLLRAAFNSDPEQAGGLGDAMVGLALSPLGPWTFAVVATGLILYGAYSLLAARYYWLSIEMDREEVKQRKKGEKDG